MLRVPLSFIIEMTKSYRILDQSRRESAPPLDQETKWLMSRITDPAGTGAVGCSKRATPMGCQTTGLVALQRPSSARSLSKCRKSLRNLLATCFHLLIKTMNQGFQQLSTDLSPSRARVTRASHTGEAPTGEARAARVPDITLIGDRRDDGASHPRCTAQPRSARDCRMVQNYAMLPSCRANERRWGR